MKIVVDLTRCQGYAQCAFAAPDVFTMLGDEALLYDPDPDDVERDKVVRAAAACPVQAILLDPGDNRRRQSDARGLTTDSGHAGAAFKRTGRIVIVGASLAGLRAAYTLRNEGFTGSLTVIGDEPYPPTTGHRCPSRFFSARSPRMRRSCPAATGSTRIGGSASRPRGSTRPASRCTWPTARR